MNNLKTQICYTKLKGTWFHIVIYCILYITSSKNIIIIAEYLFRNTTVYIIFNIRVGMRLINQSSKYKVKSKVSDCVTKSLCNKELGF